jgi:signal transduction histidine kinase
MRVIPVVAGGTAVTLAAVLQLGGTQRLDFAAAGAFLVASTVAEAYPLPLRGVAPGATSLATIFISATAALYGWQLATLVGVLTMLLVEARARKPLVQLAYNMSLYSLGGAAAGATTSSLPQHLPGGFAASTAFYLVDVGLLAAVMACIRSDTYLATLKSFIPSTLGPFVVMASTAGILVELWRESPLFGLFVIPPLVAIALYQRSLHTAFERQRELDRLKEEFVAVVSHELRTPLASVYGGVETLQRLSLPPDRREQLLTIVRQEAARLAKLVDDVLWASSSATSRQKLSVGTYDASALVAEVTATAARAADFRCHVRAVDGNEVRNVAGDRAAVERVLSNLVENAIKYSPEGGTVEVRAEATGGKIRFAVSDEGIGIPEADRERIFEKFTRLDPHMSQGVGGTGLGLYICRHLVEEMDGRIWVESNDGGGANFIVEFPIGGDHGGIGDSANGQVEEVR